MEGERQLLGSLSCIAEDTLRRPIIMIQTRMLTLLGPLDFHGAKYSNLSIGKKRIVSERDFTKKTPFPIKDHDLLSKLSKITLGAIFLSNTWKSSISSSFNAKKRWTEKPRSCPNDLPLTLQALKRLACNK